MSSSRSVHCSRRLLPSLRSMVRGVIDKNRCCNPRVSSVFNREAKIDITCEPKKDNVIDWDCIFGEDSEEEVLKYRSKDKKERATHTSCTDKDRPCSRFIVPKNVQRAETKVAYGPEGFPFLKGERYIYKYSFRAVEGMKLGKRFTHIGQIKGAYNGGQTVDGDPIVSISANLDGLHVRFSNIDKTIPDYYTHDSWYRNWEDATGEWVHVTIDTVFGESMEVEFAGGVSGKFVWPEDKTPVAWNNKGKMARMKLGLYHKEEQVGDGEVEIRDVSIEGPNGIIRTSPEESPSPSSKEDDSKGHLYLGCFEDEKDKRIFGKKYVDAHMTTAMCAGLCDDSKYFGMQYGNECWCGSSEDRPQRHGESKKCTMACVGDSSAETCGGNNAMDVYQHEGKPDDIPKGTKYLGCFADKPSDRALKLKFTASSKMDYDACKKICDKEDARYFALQYGQECFCGARKEDYDKHGPAICHMKCPGDSDLVCGGGRAQNVFLIKS
ncbi:unnamed protein product [Ectocarpus sp. 12 AP-2014]